MPTGRDAATIGARLANGTEVELRPVVPEDKPLLEQGMTLLSPASRRLRFLSAVDHLSPAQLDYLTDVDHQSHVAWGVLWHGNPVALGRLVRLPERPDAAELAVTVVDRWQRQGLGHLLVTVLAEVARAVGIEHVVFEALAENQGILRLLRPFGATHSISEGIVTGEFDVAAVPAPIGITGDLLALAADARRSYAGSGEPPSGS